MMLVTEGGGTADNAKLQIWKGPIEDPACWWYLELADGLSIPSPDLGKAAKA